MRASTVPVVLVLLTLGTIVTPVGGSSGRAASAAKAGRILFSSNRRARFDEVYVMNPDGTGCRGSDGGHD